MRAADVMTSNVITVQQDTEVREIARVLLKHRISAVPVVDAGQRVLGIVSEGDLMQRAENDTDKRPSWWLEAVLSLQDRAEEYIKTHGRKAADVMTRHVVAVAEDTPLREIAKLLEKHHIKRVPVMREGRLIGIVSRANLLHGLAAKGADGPSSSTDQLIREQLLHALSDEAGLNTALINVIVVDGTVQIWGIVDSANEKTAAQVAAENIAGVKSIENHLGQVPAWAWAD
ncbi:hypothetical protein LCGC14_0613510 [marine sediment metagenome]|uniref:CBS domain-containing protein n=2 Tax=root TaxID=1 RepID=A0A9C9TI61_9HYPH|nr:CBS domain-containing protein [Aurantimonas coralicida]